MLHKGKAQLQASFPVRRQVLFFSSSHLSTLVVLFLLYHQKIFIPLYCFGHSSSQSVSQCPLKYIVYKFYSCFRPGMGHLFPSSHLSRFFCCIILSVCFAMKLFFSFKIHCLLMLQLFQTRDGPFFSLSHLSLFFCCIIRKYLFHMYLAASSRLLKRKYLYITYCISVYNILC